MQVTITGKQMDVGDSLRGHVEARLDEGVTKYFSKPIEAHVVFYREGSGFQTDCSVHVGAGMNLQARGAAEDPHGSFDDALGRLEKRLRRYKRRLRDHHKSPRSESMQAQAYVLAPEEEEGPETPDGGPVIVAETTTDLPTVTVGEAVMRMDLADAPVQVFHNSAHGGLNVVYRRADGNVGWIDAVSVQSNVEEDHGDR